jgi:hypothetical protein
MPDADLARDVDRDAGAVEAEGNQPALVAKRRAETLPGVVDNVCCRKHFCAHLLPNCA